MMNTYELFLNTLLSLGYPVFLQGTFSGAEYPASFITFIVNSSDDREHYDDTTTSWTWEFTAIFYTKQPELLTVAPDAIRAALKAAGFIPQGKGFNIFSDDPNYSGWSTDYLFLDK